MILRSTLAVAFFCVGGTQAAPFSLARTTACSSR
jgi:hypothetical protein